MSKPLTLAVLMAALFATTTPAVQAAEVRMVGTVQEIKLAPDGKSATVVLKNVKGGAEVTVTVADTETLDKFKDKRIVKGDEVRVKYDDAKNNLTSSFKKTSGC
ncbi:MAG: hypothetical protein NZ524_01605 [Thiobacillaceae bacterium]|nr:hypothetical protein [Thiobacillaceae bacterium]MCX7672263.1 hypothetical protein [Thiobacillaceae bacterium]MDW8322949.1 hypothetical protein [Burkholderiales bacterium]